MITQLLDYLTPRRDAFVDDLADLVNLDCGSDDKAGVDAAGAIMRRLLEREGFEVTTIPVEEYGDCLHARVAGTREGKVLLLGHLDTVYPRGTAAGRPMTIRDGRILGPGASDMKAGLLAGLYAVAALRATGLDDYGEVGFFCNSDEEVGSRASRHLYADAVLAADVVLVLEAARADGSIVSGRKGAARFILTVTGRSSHAGVEPEKGANAIHELARQIRELAALNGLRPGTTVSAGTIRGGTRSNVVPDLAEAHVDVRVAEADDIPVVEGAIRTIAATTEVPGTSVQLAGGFGCPPMMKTPATALLVELGRDLAAEIGITLRDTSTGGVSDANRVAEHGRPVLDGLGPVGGLDHSPGEYVELDSIVPRTALVAALIRSAAHRRAELRSLADRPR